MTWWPNYLKRHVLHVVSLALFLFSSPMLATEQEQADSKTIYWQTYHRPPGVMKVGEHKGQGFVQLMLTAITDRMPEYEHVHLSTTLARALQDIKAGKQVCHPSLFATEQRRQFAHFTTSALFNPTNRLVVRRSTAARLGTETVDLSHILNDPTLTFSWIKGRSFGQQIDNILAAMPPTERMVELSSYDLSHIFEMIALGRVDATMAYPFELNYFNDYKSSNGEELVLLPFQGLPQYIQGNVACPRNAWGEKVVRRIDGILQEIKPTQEYADLMTTWWSEEKKRKAFKNFYINQFLQQ